MANTTKGYPYPLQSGVNAVGTHVQALAESIDSAPGIASLTTAQRTALTGSARWAGRVVFDTTTGTLWTWTGATWFQTARDLPLYANKISDQTGIVGTMVDVSSLSITFTAESGRVYRASVQALVAGLGGDEFVEGAICNASNVAIGRWAHGSPAGGRVETGSLIWRPTGLTTVKARIRRITGSNTVSVFASPAQPAQLIVEDLGAA